MNEKGIAPPWIAIIIVIGVLVSLGAYVLMSAPGQVTPPDEYPAAVQNWLDRVKERYGGITINVAAVSHPSTTAFRKLIPEFEEATGIEVNVVVYEETKYFDKLLLIASGEVVPYDIMFNCTEIRGSFAEEGIFSPVDDLLEDSEFTPDWYEWEDVVDAYKMGATYKGHVYGLLIHGETNLLAYRKDLFEEYGKEPPTTYDELLETAKFFKEEVPDVAGVSIRAKKDWEAQWAWIPFCYGYGGEFLDIATMTPQFSSPESVESLKYFVDLLKYGPVGIESFSFEEAWTNFKIGKSAMLLEASCAAIDIEDPEKSMVAGKVGYAPMPSGPAGPAAGVWNWSLAIPSVSTGEKREAAWCLMVWLTSRFKQEDYLEYGGIIVRKSGFEESDAPYDPLILESLEEVANSPLSHKMMEEWYGSPINLAAGAMIAEYVAAVETGGMTAEEACARMDEGLREMLG